AAARRDSSRKVEPLELGAVRELYRERRSRIGSAALALRFQDAGRAAAVERNDDVAGLLAGEIEVPDVPQLHPSAGKAWRRERNARAVEEDGLDLGGAAPAREEHVRAVARALAPRDFPARLDPRALEAVGRLDGDL